jgi:hypothetical protein
MKPHKLLAIFVCLALPGRLPAVASDDASWPQFRGPNGSGVANAFKPPVKIVTDRAAWKTPLPPGTSSPVLWGSRISLTGVGADSTPIEITLRLFSRYRCVFTEV